jgi:hypothetical protein
MLNNVNVVIVALDVDVSDYCMNASLIIFSCCLCCYGILFIFVVLALFVDVLPMIRVFEFLVICDSNCLA